MEKVNKKAEGHLDIPIKILMLFAPSFCFQSILSALMNIFVPIIINWNSLYTSLSRPCSSTTSDFPSPFRQTLDEHRHTEVDLLQPGASQLC